MFHRLRRYIRQNSYPIKQEVAWTWKTNLSIIYAFLGWQVIGLTVYMMLKDKMTEESGSTAYAKLLGIKNARVLTYTNGQKTGEYVLDLKQEEIDDYHEKKEIKKVEQQECRPSDGFWNRRWKDEINSKSKM